MNNLHRELAPIAEAAWAQIQEEATRTLTRHLAGRRVVDVRGPAGVALAAVGTGHQRALASPGAGVEAQLRQARHLVELRVPFDLRREEIDAVERGADDADWQPLKDAARSIAFAEDRAIFDGYPAAELDGMRSSSSNPVLALPDDVRAYPEAVAEAISALRLVGVEGPYAVALSADAYTRVSETRDYGYPVLEHLRRVVDGDIIWAPAIFGACVLTTRGGDFALHVGQEHSIGYLSHTETAVRLYLQETFSFLVLTREAAVALTIPGTSS